MSEIGDAFAALRARNRQKRQKNKVSSLAIVERAFDVVERKNGGYHLVCRHNGRVADFWPSTGKFNIRGQANYGRGVKNLIKRMTKS